MKFLLMGWLAGGLAAWAAEPVRAIAPAVLPTPELVPATVLAWDADVKNYDAKTNEPNAYFTFWVTNVSPANVSIQSVSTSCGCTVAELPSKPWILRPGENGPLKVTVDLRGRAGVVMKGVTVNSTAGTKALVVRATLPGATGPSPMFPVPANPPPGATPLRVTNSAPMTEERVHNLQVALGNRQAVFGGACARCHAEPARAKAGAELYAAVCGICHDATPRAAMVADLRRPREAQSVDAWKKIIADGRPGSLMPAFAISAGGPLSEAQIAGLAEYLARKFAQEPVAKAGTSSSGPTNSVPRSKADEELAPSRRKW